MQELLGAGTRSAITRMPSANPNEPPVFLIAYPDGRSEYASASEITPFLGRDWGYRSIDEIPMHRSEETGAFGEFMRGPAIPLLPAALAAGLNYLNPGFFGGPTTSAATYNAPMQFGGWNSSLYDPVREASLARLASAADPIEAIAMSLDATGAGTATEAAKALGYSTPEALLGAINPGWVSAGSSVLNALKEYGGAAAGAVKASGGNANIEALKKILRGEGGWEDALQLGGAVAPSLLGAYAASEQADKFASVARELSDREDMRYQDLVRRESERYADIKAREDAAIGRQQDAIQFGRGVTEPSRLRYEGSFAPGFSMGNEPGYRDALDQITQSMLRGLSVSGNPFDSPNAWEQTLTDVGVKFAFPALQGYRAQNAATGGYSSFGGAGASVPGITTLLPVTASAGSGVGTQAGAGAATGAIGADANLYNAIGSGISNVFNPPTSIADLVKLLKAAH
ncbi:MAG: hypothetical protein FJX76_01485 [Armatimonadetes bacterium]|nr:hypothetical protein [Armatimonadota bacterium]MBM3738938.1 hypothetical protein [Acidobacteriota bacterium]